MGLGASGRGEPWARNARVRSERCNSPATRAHGGSPSRGLSAAVSKRGRRGGHAQAAYAGTRITPSGSRVAINVGPFTIETNLI